MCRYAEEYKVPRTRKNFDGGPGGDLANHTVDFTIFEKSQLAVNHSVDDLYE